MIADNLRRLQPEVVFRAVKVLTVVGLGEQPGEVVATDGFTEDAYPCLDGYRYRAEGDIVLAVQLGGGGWQVLGKMDAPSEERPLTVAQVRAVVASMVAPGSLLPTPPPSVSIASDGSGSWRQTGPEVSDDVLVGSWGGPDWFGAWFFGVAIAGACNGKTVAAMTITLARLDGDDGHDWGVPLHLALHGAQTRLRPVLTDQWDPGKISAGQQRTIAVPAAQRASLASGAARGIGALGSGPDDYARLTRSATIRIDFA